MITADQGSAYTSSEFRAFCEKMEITNRVNSAKYSQGNAHAEAAVKRVKKWLKKCKDEDELSLAILAWHQTPMAPGRPSPAEIHLGRNVRDGLSWWVDQAKVDWNDVQLWREERNGKAKVHYDKGTRALKELQPGDEVFIWHGEAKRWKEGRVVQKLQRPQSYLIRTADGSEIERNRRDIKPNRSWHSKADVTYPIGVFQDCPDRATPAENDVETRAPAIRGRRTRGLDDRGPDEQPAREPAGRGVDRGAGESSPQHLAGGDVHGAEHGVDDRADSSAGRRGSVDSGTVLRGPRQNPQVKRRAAKENVNQRHDGDEEMENRLENSDARPHREKKLPVKYDDYVLY